MKKYILFCSILGSSLMMHGQDTIKLDFSGATAPNSVMFDFEDNSGNNYFYFDSTQANNLWQIGDPVKTSFTTGYMSNGALVTDTVNAYPANNISSFSIKVHHNGIGWTTVLFRHRINSDTLADGGTVEISADGNTWSNIAEPSPDMSVLWWQPTDFYGVEDTISSLGEPGFSGTSGWDFSWVNVYQGSPKDEAPGYFQLRFTFASGVLGTSPKDGWMIDDLQLFPGMSGINDEQKENRIRIFPNPASDRINYRADVAPGETILVDVLTALGELKMSAAADESGSFDLSGLSSGVYFAHFRSKGMHETKRIIVKN